MVRPLGKSPTGHVSGSHLTARIGKLPSSRAELWGSVKTRSVTAEGTTWRRRGCRARSFEYVTSHGIVCPLGIMYPRTRTYPGTFRGVLHPTLEGASRPMYRSPWGNVEKTIRDGSEGVSEVRLTPATGMGCVVWWSDAIPAMWPTATCLLFAPSCSTRGVSRIEKAIPFSATMRNDVESPQKAKEGRLRRQRLSLAETMSLPSQGRPASSLSYVISAFPCARARLHGGEISNSAPPVKRPASR